MCPASNIPDLERAPTADRTRAGSVTILKAIGGQSATKTWEWRPEEDRFENTINYGRAKRFQFSSCDVEGVRELGELIERLRAEATCFVIRGSLRPEIDATKPVLRRKRAEPPEPAYFEDVPRQWGMIDVDSYEVPEGLNLDEHIDDTIKHAIADLLPEPFREATVFWQLSSSAGFKAGLRVHLWYWFDRPVDTPVLRDWIELRSPRVDKALFDTIQAHYTADPVIRGGPDPIARRTGLIEGRHEFVTLPEMDAAALAAELGRRKRDQDAAAASAEGLSPSQIRTVDGALATMGDGLGRRGFNKPLRDAAWLYAVSTPTKKRDAAALKERMRAALLADTTRDDVSEYLNDAKLDGYIFSAFAKHPNVAEWPEHTPRYPMPTGDAQSARDRMAAAIREFLASPTCRASAGKWTDAWFADTDVEPDPEPRRGAVLVEVGLGKSEAALKEISLFVERRKTADLPHRVLYFVPEHALGSDLIRRAREKGIVVESWRGRDYVPSGETAMCDDLDAVAVALKAGADIANDVCGSDAEPTKPRCAFFHTCKYQAQRAAVATAEMVVVAHAGLFSVLLKDVTHDAALVVIDESFWQGGLRESRITLETLAQDLAQYPVLMKDGTGGQVPDDTKTAELLSFREKLHTALKDAPNGYVTRYVLQGSGLTGLDAMRARSNEWARKRKGLMRPGMAHEDRKRVADAMAINAQLHGLHALWSNVERLLDGAQDFGRLEMETLHRADGDCRIARSSILRSLSTAILELPILILDATGRLDILKQFLPNPDRHYPMWPELELLAQERPAAPHMTVHQVVGPLSKTSLDNRPALRRELRDWVALKVAGAPALVITHKDFEDDFRGLPNVEVAHFGKIAGRDSWGHVRYLFIIGRPQAAPDDTRRMAVQLFGHRVL